MPNAKLCLKAMLSWIKYIHAPTQDGNVDMGIELLLSAGANPNRVGNHGQTALHMAAQKGRLKAVEALLRHQRTRKDLRDESGRTPLHLAAQVRFTCLYSSPEC